MHRPEVAELMREVTGCRVAVVYEPLIRSPQTAVSTVTTRYRVCAFGLQPELPAHGERPESYLCGVSATALAANDLSYDDVINAQRIAVAALAECWSSTARPPLAVCDASTVSDSELMSVNVPTTAVRNWILRHVFAKPNPVDAHCWYTFPQMTEQEVLCLPRTTVLWTISVERSLRRTLLLLTRMLGQRLRNGKAWKCDRFVLDVDPFIQASRLD